MNKTLKRDHGVAIWRQVSESLKLDITNGLYQAGDKLPNEFDLAKNLGINRHTVRRAFADLIEQGLVEAKRGKGTFVADRAIEYPIGERTRFSEIIAAQDFTPSGKLLAVDLQKATARLARKLDVQEGTPLICMETLHSADGRPMSYSKSWFIEKDVPDIEKHYRKSESFTVSLSAHGFEDYKRRETRILAQAVELETGLHLDLPNGSPLLVCESINVDGTGRPIQFTIAKFAPSRVQIIIEP